MLVEPDRARANSSVVFEDTLTFLGENGVVFLVLLNETAEERVQINFGTVICEPVLTTLLFQTASIENSLEAVDFPTESACNEVHTELDIETSF